MKYILIISFTFFFKNVIGQRAMNCCDRYDSITHMHVATFVDQMPKFPGGEDSLFKFIRKNFHYPKQKIDYLESSIKVAFVVNSNGRLIGIRVIGKKKKDMTLIEKEVLRVFSIMPNWIPGRCNNEIIPVYIKFPMHIEPQY